ncbi:hypothetical protein ACQUQP_16620 [Marinobacterium sp. YM272]|uniref:hypothetical protein n=1 Tax=Marinobacterium sp. YM272 TaxID=3421654 RepID=UPI003D7F485F
MVGEVQQNIESLNAQAGNIRETSKQTSDACAKLQQLSTSLESMAQAFATR